MKKLLFLLLTIFLTTLGINAQDSEVTGTDSNELGIPIIGFAVVVKSTTKN